MKIPFKNSCLVIENKLIEGCVPIDFAFKKYHKIDQLLKLDIDTIIDLRDNYLDFKLMNYRNYLQKNHKNIEVYNFKIKDFTCPSREIITEILDLIDLKINKGHKIYIHCLGGIGRTGTIIGSYKLRHKICNDKNILEYMQNLRLKNGCKKIKSPETNEQISMVVNWKY